MDPRILCLAMRTSGTNARVHSILEIGARWFSGPRAGEEFDGFCSPFPGSEWDDRTEELSGISRGSLDHYYLDLEAELIDAFVNWSGRESILLAGFWPRTVRAFLLAAYARARGARVSAPLAGFHPRVIDFYSLRFHCAAMRGEVIPSSGFPSAVIAAEAGVQPITRRDPALHCARVQCEILASLMRFDRPAGS